MKWSEAAWRQTETLYHTIVQMPFIQELSRGSLSMERFRFYMAQDALYLEHFSRVLSLIGAKVPDIEGALAFMRFAQTALVVERELHASYFKDFGVLNKGTVQPACHHYVHFLRSTILFDPVEVGMAAVLPCFWIYQKVGDHILAHQSSVENPYNKWIATYGGEEFAKTVQSAIDICDRAAARSIPQMQQCMTEAFITSSRLEFDFWQSAYTFRRWT